METKNYGPLFRAALFAAVALGSFTVGCSSSDKASDDTDGGVAAGGSADGGAGGAGSSDIAGSGGSDSDASPALPDGGIDSGRVEPNVLPGDRARYCLDYDWKFIQKDVANAQSPTFEDAAWKSVSLPHTFNDVDHWDNWITAGGDNGHYAGKTWYRKHFKIPEKHAGSRVILEFEGVRQVGTFYLNGVKVGLHENGVGPIGLDVTSVAKFGTNDNLLAVMVDSTQHIKEQSSGVDYQWDTPPFNPEYGGIVKNAFLHVMNPVHQTLPLYSNLKTSGVYVYQANVDVAAASADLTVQAEVVNESASPAPIDYSIDVYDWDGKVVLSESAKTAQNLAAGATRSLTLTGRIQGVHFWSPDNPYLYRVYSQLKIGDKVIDAVETSYGIRLVAFQPGQGLVLNGRPLYLQGYAPRSTMEWATVGQAPNWLEEYDFLLMKQSNANFLRPMHTAPRKADVDASDKLGFLVTVPAGDSELDVTGRMWDQRVELMRDVMIYFRNHPSVMFYETGNGGIALEHMQQMIALRDEWDPHGNRFIGDRTPPPETKALLSDPTHQLYLASMDVPATSTTVPMWDAEYCRSECPRRVWDAYSPPSSWTGGSGTWLGYRSIAGTNKIELYPTTSFLYNSSEDLARRNVLEHYRRWSLRGGQGKSEIMVGGAKILFADSVSHGRLSNVEVARVSGAVDGVRLPKETFYAIASVWSPVPAAHILGHWSYPSGTLKDVFVISNCERVKLVTYDANGKVIKDYGYGVQANRFEFAFPKVEWAAGKIEAIGYNGDSRVVAHEIVTAGAPAKLKITQTTGPMGFLADGSDVAMFDIELVDAKGIRCPNEESTVNFTAKGQGTFLGGYNSGIEHSLFRSDLKVEAGVNRVFTRATRTAGDFTLTVARDGLAPASVTITSKPIGLTDGLVDDPKLPQGYAPPAVR